MSIRIEKCPNCGKTLNMGRGSKQGTIGIPFRSCHFCGTEYLENSCYEYAAADTIQKLISLNAFGNNLAFSTLIALFLAFASNNYFLTFFVLTVLIDAIFTAINFLKQLDKISESIKRCENPYYVLKLASVGCADINSNLYKEALLQVRQVSGGHIDYLHELALKKHTEKKTKYMVILGIIIFLVLLVIIPRISNGVISFSASKNINANIAKVEQYLEEDNFSKAIKFAEKCRNKAYSADGTDGELYQTYDELLCNAVRRSVSGVWMSEEAPFMIYIFTDKDTSFSTFHVDSVISKDVALKIYEEHVEECTVQITSVSVSRGASKGIYICIEKGGEGFSVDYNMETDSVTINDTDFVRLK